MFQDVLLKETFQSSSLTFTRSSITCSHAGVYTCRGDNQQSQSPSSSINLFVRCSPRPLHQIKKNKTSSLYVPTTLTFTTIAYPVPGPTGFLWHKENGLLWMPLLSSNDLLVSSSGSQSHLTILNVSQSDYGRYKVTATNDVGSYVQYLFLLREDIQRQTYTTETCAVETNKTGTILGICFGILSAGLLVYASYLTILHKRRSTEKGKQKTEDLNTQVAYINVAEEGTVVEINASSENKDSEKVYTELSQYSKDDKSTYDVIQKN
ncbi:uncharacterized protein LOC123534418 isoform X2 [Mercenaria mercenaria]|uniref:uncharacterized protein LOC123534418 isoform X2 n=1 Tax=Mercenaria mercenaria TaxID=6596 RepID=UPI00234F9C07|nr:uncharacterized protein LOC123534418 isoform X2 [Mercenaria mercenaria]